jgi:hypothetical protein
VPNNGRRHIAAALAPPSSNVCPVSRPCLSLQNQTGQGKQLFDGLMVDSAGPGSWVQFRSPNHTISNASIAAIMQAKMDMLGEATAYDSQSFTHHGMRPDPWRVLLVATDARCISGCLQVAHGGAHSDREQP